MNADDVKYWLNQGVAAKRAEMAAAAYAGAPTVDEVVALLPPSYYMDPPDGGSVSLLEQLQRMAKDAARYRWLRQSGNAELYVWAPGADPCKGICGEGLDEAVGEAIEAEKPSRCQACDGRGRVNADHEVDESGRTVACTTTCDACNGEGKAA